MDIDEIREMDYSLSPKKYVGGIDHENIPFQEAKKDYIKAMESLRQATTAARKALIKGGYV